MKIMIYSDGVSRGNPGQSAIAFIIIDEGGEIIKKKSKYNGIKTNNQSEYEALIFSLQSALEFVDHDINCYSDSELVIKQLNGEYSIKNSNLKKLFTTVQNLILPFHAIKFIHVSRNNKFIQIVDRLANKELDKYLKK